jgi:hypothetical protein
MYIITIRLRYVFFVCAFVFVSLRLPHTSAPAARDPTPNGTRLLPVRPARDPPARGREGAVPPPAMATTDREKEREAELEGAMYTNCLLLGLDPAVLGSPTGPRVGLFRHSNPRLGEQLLYFLLSSLRGPAKAQSDPFLLFFADCCFLSSPHPCPGRFRVFLTFDFA